VLVVDDHADTARAIRRLLTAGAPVRCEVRTAGSVGEALTACRDGAIDLLISDIGLPDGSGLDLMRELRARHGSDQVKGIALSGYGMEDDVRRSRTAGYDAHLTKPVTAAALHGAVRAVVGSPS
jgi:CheY-like chemotaxis protein